MIYYTSDQHFCHANIINLCDRPFSTVGGMNEYLITCWNAKVRSNEDTVYILGDLFFKHGNIDQVKTILKRLNGRKILIKGNHDVWLNELEWKDYFVKVCDYLKIKDQERSVVLMHYPIEEWDGFFRDTYHLYGHVHNNENNLRIIDKRYNVGVDVNDFEPKTLDELIERNK